MLDVLITSYSRESAVPRPRVVALGVLACYAGFAVFAVRAWQNNIFSWDARVSRAIHDLENRDAVWNRHVDVFSLVLSVYAQALGAALVAAVLVLLLDRGRYREAIFVVAGVAGAAAIGVVAKAVVAQPPVDPNGSGFSFPSGHAVRSMAAALVLVVVAWKTRWRRAVAAAGAFLVALMGVAVVYEEWHWASDVLGGWLLSAGWLGCVALAFGRGRTATKHESRSISVSPSERGCRVP